MSLLFKLRERAVKKLKKESEKEDLIEIIDDSDEELSFDENEFEDNTILNTQKKKELVNSIPEQHTIQTKCNNNNYKDEFILANPTLKNDSIHIKYNINPAREDTDEIHPALKQVADAMKILSKYTFEELDQLYQQDKQPKFEFPTLNKKIGAIAVDPAGLTCALALADLKRNKILEVDIRAFRFKNTPPDLGKMNLLKSVDQYTKILKCDFLIWVIEDQIANYLSKQNPENMAYLWESSTIQYFLMALFIDSHIIVAPKAVSEFFSLGKNPELEGCVITNDKKKIQYDYKKTRAVLKGRKMVDNYISDRIVSLCGYDDHNIYDAILIGIYFCGKLNFCKKHVDDVEDN